MTTSHSNRKQKGATLILGKGMSPDQMGIEVTRVIWHGPRPKRLISNGQVIGTVGIRIPLGPRLTERRFL